MANTVPLHVRRQAASASIGRRSPSAVGADDKVHVIRHADTTPGARRGRALGAPSSTLREARVVGVGMEDSRSARCRRVIDVSAECRRALGGRIEASCQTVRGIGRGPAS